MKKGNILIITFIMLTTLAALVGSYSFVIAIMVKRSGVDTRYTKALYYAEAGLAKAIWYLKTPTYLGGQGSTWRTTNFTENVGGGSFKLIVENSTTPIEIKITSQGKFGTTTRTLQAKFQTYPPAFGYAIFSKQKINAAPYVQVRGDVYVDANVFVDNHAYFNGFTIVTPATPEHTVTGLGSYTTAPMPIPAPLFPTLETQYYDDRITAAGLVAPGSKTYPTSSFQLSLNLGGGTINVNGNIRIRPSPFWTIYFINGPGEIVATGSITVESDNNDHVYISDNIKLIAGKNLDIQEGAQVEHDSVLFGRESISIKGNVNNDPIVSLLTPKKLYLCSGSYITGIINAGWVTYEGAAVFLGSAQIGSYGGAQMNLGTSARSYHYYTKLPAVPPPGIPFVYIQVPGSWQEL